MVTGVDARLAVLLAAHGLGTEVPADVALARHADTGCTCDPGRITGLLGSAPVVTPSGGGTVTLAGEAGEAGEAEVRLGPFLAVRFHDHGHWLRLPDLVSACWYVAAEIGLVESANDVDAGFTCLTVLAAMGQTLDEVGFGEEEWVRAGTALLPSRSAVPDRLVLAENSYEGSGQTPVDSDGTVFLIEVDGAYLFGGTDEMMDWTEVGPFVNEHEAMAWFEDETSEIDDNDEDGD